MMNSHGGACLPSHIFHHSRLTSAPSSPVGFCWYWAFHFDGGNSSFSASNSFNVQNSGHKGLPDGNIAGNSMTSQSSPVVLFIESAKTRPVKSFSAHLVITITIVPPG